MNEPHGAELIARYKANYDIANESHVDEAMILKHWQLEKLLRLKLLKSTAENRWDTFAEAYTTLYCELGWLNNLVRNDCHDSLEAQFGHWAQLIGPPPQKVYEVGSGRGELIGYLAEQGYECMATEITQERGDQWTSRRPNLRWGISDGIHFGQFEPARYYDVVLSQHVIEHLHPDDLLEHFRGVLAILVDRGRYLFSTPHQVAGPSDVSRVFRHDAPIGMHLKEYTYRELNALLKQAGFMRVTSPLRPSTRIRAMLGKRFRVKSSGVYLSYLRLLETLIALLPRQTVRRHVSKCLKSLLFTSNIMLIAEAKAAHRATSP